MSALGLVRMAEVDFLLSCLTLLSAEAADFVSSVAAVFKASSSTSIWSEPRRLILTSADEGWELLLLLKVPISSLTRFWSWNLAT